MTYRELVRRLSDLMIEAAERDMTGAEIYGAFECASKEAGMYFLQELATAQAKKRKEEEDALLHQAGR